MPGLPPIHTYPKPVCLTAYQLAQRYLGTKEVPGADDNPVIMAMLRLDDAWPQHDEVPWCSAFLNWICWHLNVQRSHSKMARSWLNVGTPIRLNDAVPGFDVVVLKRGTGDQPGPTVTDAPGHVGFFSDLHASEQRIQLLDGNSSNQVTYTTYPVSRLLGVRRLRL